MLEKLWKSVVGRTIWSKDIHNANEKAQVYIWQRGEAYSVWFRSDKFYDAAVVNNHSGGAGYRIEAIPYLIDALKEAQAELQRLQAPKLGRQTS